jgi:CRISPR type IV-associated protein Csf3
MASPDDRQSYEPLRVTAHLRTGVVADRWLPLDGILLYQAARAQLGDQVVTVPGGSPAPGGVSVPLKVLHPGEDHWYYACSWAQPQPWWAAEGQDHWNKRFDNALADLVDFGGKRGRVIVEKGEYKAYHMPVHYYAAAGVEWFCIGDRAEIARLLATCTHIGKKASQGWGRVAGWQVEPWAEDWTVRRDGLLTRAVPIQDALPGEAGRLMFYGLRPPYYRKENQLPVVMPATGSA